VSLFLGISKELYPPPSPGVQAIFFGYDAPQNQHVSWQVLTEDKNSDFLD
jgi:hypothetical protein